MSRLVQIERKMSHEDVEPLFNIIRNQIMFFNKTEGHMLEKEKAFLARLVS